MGEQVDLIDSINFGQDLLSLVTKFWRKTLVVDGSRDQERLGDFFNFFKADEGRVSNTANIEQTSACDVSNDHLGTVAVSDTNEVGWIELGLEFSKELVENRDRLFRQVWLEPFHDIRTSVWASITFEQVRNKNRVTGLGSELVGDQLCVRQLKSVDIWSDHDELSLARPNLVRVESISVRDGSLWGSRVFTAIETALSRRFGSHGWNEKLLFDSKPYLSIYI